MTDLESDLAERELLREAESNEIWMVDVERELSE